MFSLPAQLALFASLACLFVVRADNLFVGCGDELLDVDMAFTTDYSSVCMDMCKRSGSPYYTFLPDQGMCDCYSYPPAAAEYMPGNAGSCTSEYQYNLITSDWTFDACYDSLGSTPAATQFGADSFKGCMEACGGEVAIAQPTGDYPGYTSCLCFGAWTTGTETVTCDLDKYFVYKKSSIAKRARSFARRAIPERVKGESERTD